MTIRSRLLAVSIACAVAFPLAGPLPSAHANVETCQGQPATIVGTTGTEGNDVMVVPSPSTERADAKGGDDLICLVGGTPEAIAAQQWSATRYEVDAGTGDDTVINVAGNGVSVALGPGRDTFQGNDEWEEVFGGPRYHLGETFDDGDRDVILTSDGSDTIYTGSEAPGASNADWIETGTGHDTVHWAGWAVAGSRLDNGVDPDHLSLRPGWTGSRVSVDNLTRTATADGTQALTWTAVSEFSLGLTNPTVAFTGSDTDETLRISVRTNPQTVYPALGGQPYPIVGERSADLGGGDDHVDLRHPSWGRIDGGAGDDHIESSWCVDAVVRLDGERRCFNGETWAVTSLDNLEAATISADRRGLLIGTPRSDTLRVGWAAEMIIRGRGGDDELTLDDSEAFHTRTAVGGRGDDTIRGTVYEDRIVGGAGDDRIIGMWAADHILGGAGADRLFGGRGRDRILGGSGRDRIAGNGHGDVLHGGQGRDVALGGAGPDRCRAETVRDCEGR